METGDGSEPQSQGARHTHQMEPILLNQYAVVAYIDGPLASFVNALRCELTPGCPHRAHITVLPPRELHIPVEEALEQCAQILSRFQPFDAVMAEVDLFPQTQVVKLTVGEGASELRTLHDILNTGPFEQVENYDYVPHITLCKDTTDEEVGGFFDRARARWKAFGGTARVHVDVLTLVQQRADGIWVDLHDIAVGAGSPQGVRVRRS